MAGGDWRWVVARQWPERRRGLMRKWWDSVEEDIRREEVVLGRR